MPPHEKGHLRTLCHELIKNGRTDRDAIWYAELGGSREHALHGDVDAPTGRGSFGCLAVAD